MNRIKDPYSIAIIGPGKVGTSLGILYAQNGGRVIAVGGRNLEKARIAAAQIDPEVISTNIVEAASLADYVVISVADDAIKTVCEMIADKKGFRNGSVVIHCSGALSRNELISAREKSNCRLGSMHPLQTFPNIPSALQTLPGTYCFYEGDNVAITFMKYFSRKIGMKAEKIDGDLKSLYHASAVIACNYVTALLDAAIETASLSGIEPQKAWLALRPLIEATLLNIDQSGTGSALTGPISRGDIHTVRRHLYDLDNHCPEIGPLYRELGLRTLAIAYKKKGLSNERHEMLLNLLKSSGV